MTQAEYEKQELQILLDKLKMDWVLQGKSRTYKILEKIAISGMSAVLKAEPSDGQPTRVAIKVVSDELFDKPEFVEKARTSLKSEAGLLMSLPNDCGIPTVFDYIEKGKNAYIIMEYISGNTLQDMVETSRSKNIGGMEEEFVLVTAIEILKIFEILHKKDLVYRDTKPANIIRNVRKQWDANKKKLVCVGSRLYVVDLGITKKLLQLTGLLKPNTCIGTEYYAAPEQYSAKGILGPWSDCYSLGVVLWEMLSGLDPRNEPEPFHFRDLRAIRTAKALCEKTILAVEKALVVPVAGRWQSAREMRSALQGALNEILPKPIAPQPRPIQSAAHIQKRVAQPHLSGMLQGPPPVARPKVVAQPIPVVMPTKAEQWSAKLRGLNLRRWNSGARKLQAQVQLAILEKGSEWAKIGGTIEKFLEGLYNNIRLLVFQDDFTLCPVDFQLETLEVVASGQNPRGKWYVKESDAKGRLGFPSDVSMDQIIKDLIKTIRSFQPEPEKLGVLSVYRRGSSSPRASLVAQVGGNWVSICRI